MYFGYNTFMENICIKVLSVKRKILLLLLVPLLFVRAQNVNKEYLINSIINNCGTNEQIKELIVGVYRTIDSRYLKISYDDFYKEGYYKIFSSTYQYIKNQLQKFDKEDLIKIQEICSIWSSNCDRYKRKMNIEAERQMNEEGKQTGGPVVVRTEVPMKIPEENLKVRVDQLRSLGYESYIIKIIDTLGEKVVLSGYIKDMTNANYSEKDIKTELNSDKINAAVKESIEMGKQNSTDWQSVFFNISLLIVDQFQDEEFNYLSNLYSTGTGKEYRKINKMVFDKILADVVNGALK
jgi:hypothetical protein